MKTQTEKLNVRDFVTIAILTVVELAVYFVIGMPLGSTPLSWIFCLGIQALPLGIVFMLMYTKVNKKGTVLISGLLLAALLLMNLWMVSLCVAAAAIIGEIIWEKCDRKKFSTKLKKVSLGFYQNNNTGELTSAVTTDLSFFEMYATNMIDVVVNSYIFVCGDSMERHPG